MAFSILYYAFGIYHYFDNSCLNSSQAKTIKRNQAFWEVKEKSENV